MVFDFEKLDVYQKALMAVDEVYKVTKGFPSEERFGLTDQFRRAAISIALNVAEGSGRTKRDFCHFLRNARASCYECIAILHISRRRFYLSQNQLNDCARCFIEISKMISGLIRSIGGKPL